MQKDSDVWGHPGGIAEEIDSQVAKMPDRPPFLLAIIRINKTPAEARFREVGVYKDYFIRDLPYAYFDQKFVVSLLGFEAKDSAAFMGVVCSLSLMNIDEAIVYLDGKPSLRISKLKLISN